MSATVHVTAVDGFLLVVQEGALGSEDDARAMQEAVERGMADSGSSRVIFDNRQTQPGAEEAHKSMHAWLTTPGRFERAALVLESDTLRTAVNMDALGKGLRLKAFNELSDAEGWIRRG